MEVSAEPFVFELSGPVTYFGIRFRIPGQQSLMATPLGDWNNDEHTIHSIELLADAILNPVYMSGTGSYFHSTPPIYFSYIAGTDKTH